MSSSNKRAAMRMTRQEKRAKEVGYPSLDAFKKELERGVARHTSYIIHGTKNSQ